MVVKTISIEGAIAPEVLQFAQEQGILEYVEKALAAAREVFTNGEPITVSLKRDPEFGFLYVDVRVVLPDNLDLDESLQKDDDCVSKWVAQIPPELGGLIHYSSSWALR